MDNMIIILVLLSNDKTQLSTIVGKLAFWSIYLTIGNLNHKTRRQRRKPSELLLSLLVIYKGDNMDVKLDVYYTCLEFMTKY